MTEGPTTETADPQSFEALEALARNSLRRIERRRFELLGLTLFVMVAFAGSVVVLALPEAIDWVDDFETTLGVLRFSLLPLSIGFAAYLYEKERQLRRLTREVYGLEAQAGERLRMLYEMKDALLTAVSHEVRTPLTSARGYAQILVERGDSLPEDRRRDFAARAAENLTTLERLLEDLLDVDRLWREAVDVHRRPTDLAELARRSVEGFTSGDGRSVEVEADPCVIAVDGPKVERIIEALLANVKRHTDPATSVWVRVLPQPGGAQIAVEDAGPGVPPGLKDAVFRPFRQGPTAPAHSPGTGIGLTIVERLAELHGGRAWVEDRVGGGSSFRVFLPDGGEGDPETVRDLKAATRPRTDS